VQRILIKMPPRLVRVRRYLFDLDMKNRFLRKLIALLRRLKLRLWLCDRLNWLRWL
jgi:hypothetical protein